MICSKCGQEFEGNFCPNCGTPGKSGLDLFEDDTMFDSIESNILSDADAEYNREVGSVVSGAGSQRAPYRYADDPDYESGYEQDDEDEPEYESGYPDDYDYEEDHEDEPGCGSGKARKSKRDKKDVSKPRASRSGGRVKKGISGASYHVEKGVRTAVHIVFRIMKWASGLLMLATVAQLFKGFWAQRSALGSMTEFIYEKNYPEEVYLIGAACVLIFAIIQFFWIMSSQRGMRLGMVQRIDSGRGLFGFAVYLVLGLVSGTIVHFIPSSPSVLIGVRQVFSVIGSLPKIFLITNLVGIILCFLRKLNRMM